MSGSTVLATATTETTSGTQATFTVSSNAIPLGTYPNITAVYSANGAFLGSTSPASATPLTVSPVPAPQGTIAQWTFENDAIGVNNSPAPSTGTGTASGLGMTNSYNSTTSTNTDDVTGAATGDTGTNTLADTTQIWRVRGQSPGNGWSSQAAIGTQGAVFATSTANHAGADQRELRLVCHKCGRRETATRIYDRRQHLPQSSDNRSGGRHQHHRHDQQRGFRQYGDRRRMFRCRAGSSGRPI